MIRLRDILPFSFSIDISIEKSIPKPIRKTGIYEKLLLRISMPPSKKMATEAIAVNIFTCFSNLCLMAPLKCDLFLKCD